MLSEESVVTVPADAGPGPVAGTDVVFLPQAFDHGTPVYPAHTTQLVDQLTAQGVTARTWHPAAESEILSARGPVADTLLQIAVGIASSAGWYAIQSMLRSRSGPLRVIAVFEQDGQRRRAELAGNADDVVRALETLDPFGPGRPD
ncbi:hypothetical protein EDC02_2133 [Micromonospora sp. Llam0]|uniref:hypothetical protein n=1 Tax=Micromonospora sp. Llam0 TaxID=2485143 RepID=UPI000F460F0C|nr:hypothetical protein [Micromonospora sp. Llam0]ROO60274.1 hypothetical protein EDC02_2133 [Micromonospora sp. Llam0]